MVDPKSAQSTFKMAFGAERLAGGLNATIDDERVRRAILEVPRDLFVPAALRDQAWEDVALPIACDQTISQPRVVARMCELLELRGNEIVLDVGTGSGYHAAVLSRLSRHVYSIERHAELSRYAQRALEAALIENVTLLIGDGTAGYEKVAPYDAINVAAGSECIPSRLEQQLVDGGRLIIPVGSRRQRLVLVRRTGLGFAREQLDAVSFVPLV
jgi:protein-L-isoaspartate(D-aspartate) O-methyltransferase